MLAGLQVRTSRSTTNLEIGWQIELTCSSDFDIISVDWYQGFNRIQRSNSSQSTLVRQSITTDDHGSVYRCFVRSPYAIQSKDIRLSVRGMHVNIDSVRRIWSTLFNGISRDYPIHVNVVVKVHACISHTYISHI